MPTTAPNTPGSGALSSSILPDTQALRRVFDADFTSLVAKARGHLGDAGQLAPRVAEGALVRAWDARARLQTAEQLKQFLDADIEAAAKRALAKRASSAARTGGTAPAGGEPQIDKAQSWAFIVDAIHVDPRTAQESKEAVEAMRHDTADRVSHAALGIGGKAIAAIVIIGAVIAFVAERAISRASTERVFAEAVASGGGSVTASQFGQMADVTLKDGTKVHLAPDSKLLIPQEFGDRVRVVKLDGAGSFDVAKGAGQFRVYLRNAVVIATGTKFVASGYWADKRVVVKVTEGSVDVRTKSGTDESTTTLGEGKALAVDSTGAAHDASTDEADEATSWATGKLVIVNRPLREVVNDMQCWYGLAVNVTKLNQLDKPVTIRASVDSSAVALDELQKSSGLKLVNQNNNLVLVDPADAAAPTAAKKK